MRRLHRPVSRYLLYVLVGLGLCVGLRAAAPPDLLGTKWSLWGSSKTSVKGEGSVTVAGPLYVEITDDGEFIATDAAGASIFGRYELDARGRPQAVITADDIEDFILTGLEELAGPWFVDAIESLEASGVSAKLSASANAAGSKMAFSLRFRVDLTVDSGEGLVDLVLNYSLSCKGAKSNQVQDVAGLTVGLAGKHAFSAGRAKVKGTVDQTLFFGPNNSLGLAEHEYQLRVGDQVVISGLYVPMDKKVYFEVSEAGLDAGAEYLENLAYEGADLETFYFYYGIGTLTGSLGRNGQMTLKGSFRFEAEIDYGDGARDVLGKYTFTTAGTVLD